MKNTVLGAALVAALLAAPAIAKDNQAMKEPGSQQSTSFGLGDDSRHRSADGTLQGKHVIEGPVHWNDDGSASTGDSTGESGSESGSTSP